MEVVPVNDIQEHLLGDECWCLPKVEKVFGGVPDTMITHNSKDRRESIEQNIVVTS